MSTALSSSLQIIPRPEDITHQGHVQTSIHINNILFMFLSNVSNACWSSVYCQHVQMSSNTGVTIFTVLGKDYTKNSKTNLTKAKDIHQTNKPPCLITANMSSAIYLCYFLPAQLQLVNKHYKKRGKKMNLSKSFQLAKEMHAKIVDLRAANVFLI